MTAIERMARDELERVARALAAADNPGLDQDSLACGGEPLRLKVGGYLVGDNAYPLWVFYIPMARIAISAVKP